MAEQRKRYNNYYAPPPSTMKISQDGGQLQPQALELEEAVLGALMLEKDAIIEVLDLLKPDMFYKDSHQKIYSAIVELSSNHNPIDILTVTEQLRSRMQLDENLSPYYVTQLTSRVASAANIGYHARIIAQKYIQRELIRVTSEIHEQAFDPTVDVDTLLDKAEQGLFDVAYGHIKKETAEIKPLISIAIKKIEEAALRPDGLSGVPSGFSTLDRITSGWQNSDLVILAARPSMGKTAFVLSMARNMAAVHKVPTAIFSLEMSSLQLVNRLIVSETGLGSDKVRNGRLSQAEWQDLDYKVKCLEDAPIFIDDTPALSIFELRAKCRRLKMKNNIKAVIIDYLQLMTAGGDSKSREQEVSTISRALKAIAKELDIPVIALSQLNRSVEMRGGDKRPQLSDLRESGAIEQDADLVLFIHRPEKYGITEDEEGNSTKGMAEIIIAKHRNGAVTDIKLRFVNELAKFADFDDDTLPPLESEDSFSAVEYGSKMNSTPTNDSFSSIVPIDEAPF